MSDASHAGNSNPGSSGNPIGELQKSAVLRALFFRKPLWRKQLEASGLPGEIKNLIRSVIVQSKLAAFEKADVAADLIGHFVDGQRHGKQFSTMAKDFGDVAVTASLIRRSKIRNRPMMYKIFRGMMVGVGAFVVAYLGLLAFFHLGEPNPTIDFLTDWNAEVANIPVEEQAWPIYRPAWIKHSFGEGGQNNFAELFVEDGDTNRLVQPFDDQWTEAMAKLDECQDLLEAFRLGAKLPSLGVVLQTDARLYSDEDFAALFPHTTKEEWTFDVDWLLGQPSKKTIELLDGSVVGILLPHIQSFRKAARIFRVDTRRAMIEGDIERVVSNIETTWGLAHQCGEANCLVCALVAFAVNEIGNEQLEEVLLSDPAIFTEEQLERLQIAAEKVSPRQWLKYSGEKTMLLDLVQRVYTDDGNGDGRITDEGVTLLAGMSEWFPTNPGGSQRGIFKDIVRNSRPVLAPASLFVCASRKEVTEKCDELFTQLSADKMLPFWQSEDLGIEEFLHENTYRHYFLAAMIPATQQVRNAMDRTIGRQEGVIAALAIHRYFKKYDTWPESYEQVSPEFVTEFPLDQLDGSLLKFKYNEDELMVYSIGRDYDDDGGSEHGQVFNGTFTQDEDRSSFVMGPKSDLHEGDWILWPQNAELH